MRATGKTFDEVVAEARCRTAELNPADRWSLRQLMTRNTVEEEDIAMTKVRRCDKRCHSARGARCRCWCGGAFHGSAGVANRQTLAQGVTQVLVQAGFKEGKTAYIEQKEMPLEGNKDHA